MGIEGAICFNVFLWAVGMFVLYWVIRHAVAGAITDVENRRAREETERRYRRAETSPPEDDDEPDEAEPDEAEPDDDDDRPDGR